MTLNSESNTSKLSESKYKTCLCRHFNSQNGCSLGEKCNFAHGINELRQNNNLKNNNEKKKEFNPLNYKIVKCKYWEKEGSCRYGAICTFAHGNLELRSKKDNMKISSLEIKKSPLLVDPFLTNFDPFFINVNFMKFQNFNLMNCNLMDNFNEENEKEKDIKKEEEKEKFENN